MNSYILLESLLIDLAKFFLSTINLYLEGGNHSLHEII